MVGFDYDLRYLRAGIENLESYLLSDELYWPVDARAQAGEPAFPNPTLGSLLLAQGRLQAREQTLEQETQLIALLSRLEQLRVHWRSAWRKKVERSLRSRLTLWSNFMDDYRRAPEANADRYPYEVTRRVMIDLLQAELDWVLPADQELLAKLDAFINTFLVRGDCIWDPALANGFPPQRYWYLYGRLPDELKLLENYSPAW